MNEAYIQRNRLAGETLAKAFRKRQFEAFYCDTKDAALEKALSLITRTDTVSWGGSRSAVEIGLIDAVKKSYRVIDRDTAKSPDERKSLMKQALTSDTFIMGVNAVSADGQLVNIDGNGNRVAALCYGPDSIIVICGINKLCTDIESAVKRARNTAAPVNLQRFANLNTPCHKTGMCADCVSPDCGCSQIVITRMCKPAGRIKIIIVGEGVGF